MPIKTRVGKMDDRNGTDTRPLETSSPEQADQPAPPHSQRRKPWQRFLRLVGRAAIILAVLSIIVFVGREQQIMIELVVAVIVLVLLLLIISRVARAFRDGTIRTRLRISFIVAVLVPVILIGATAGIQGYTNERERAQAQLELVATTKKQEINLWVEQLYTTLDSVFFNEVIEIQAVMVLDNPIPNLEQIQRGDVMLRFQEILDESNLFTELFLLDRYGAVLISTNDSQQGVSYAREPFFRKGKYGTYIQPPFLSAKKDHQGVTIVKPVLDFEGEEAVGVLGAQANLDILNQITVDRYVELGETGQVYLVGYGNGLLTDNTAGNERGTHLESLGINYALENRGNGSGSWEKQDGIQVLGIYKWIPSLEVALLAEQSQSEAFRPLQTTLAIVGGVALFSLSLAIIAALLITQSIANPLSQLAETASQIAAGNLNLTAAVERDDETSELARAFNSMTGQLRGLISSLEERVMDRTQDLEQRSNYLEAAADVGRAATSILEADQLIRQVVELIRQRFDLYYVGLFLTDESKQWALLRAGTGTAGRMMLARAHKIRVGEGMVGWSIVNAEARVALEAGKDAVQRATAELPETRSEAAIPLRSRGQVIGAFSIQDRRPEAFGQDTIAVFQTMADQVAVALDNAQLFAQSQAALETAQRAFGELTGEAWAELLQVRPKLGFKSTEQGVKSLYEPDSSQEKLSADSVTDDGQPLVLPISVRGRVIGALDTYKPGERGSWTPDEVALLETIVDQLGVALDNARLFEDSQRRAAREQLARQITDKVRAVSDIDAIAQTAAEELGKALGIKQSFVSLTSNRSEDKGNGHN